MTALGLIEPLDALEERVSLLKRRLTEPPG
jgi:hypothetical protein